ncbi:MAG: hypothetical protein M1343_13145 [Chloroflexi bacterium]|nr:hypothetical protein [Chloroflexota bacterium]MDA8188068.1 hypothetical protein [Dehalococcoidales bacterium]
MRKKPLKEQLIEATLIIIGIMALWYAQQRFSIIPSYRFPFATQQDIDRLEHRINELEMNASLRQSTIESPDPGLKKKETFNDFFPGPKKQEKLDDFFPRLKTNP